MDLTGLILDILHEESRKTSGTIIQYGRKELENKLGVILSDQDFETAIKELELNKLINVFPPLGKQTYTVYKISHKGFVGMEKFKESNESWKRYHFAIENLTKEGHGFFDKSLIDEAEKAKKKWQQDCNDFSNWLCFQKQV